MKRLFNNLLLTALAILLASAGVFAQTAIQYYRPSDQRGINVFEISKKDTVEYDGLKVKVGGDFALQFQGISHSNAFPSTATPVDPELIELGSNFNLPTANLNLDVQLYDGMRMHLRTYLSSRHHTEAYVKGGHLAIDKLDFIRKDFAKGFMDIATIKIGLDEINYGDAHFRRSDNAGALYNPFVGNYIMDAFTTEAFGELTLQPNDLIFVVGVSNGNLNQSVNNGTSAAKKENKLSAYVKAGWDKQINDDLRVRVTASFLNSPGYDNGRYLYGGDRTGARYYHVMEAVDAGDDFRSGRFNPGFRKFNSFQVNPFVKYTGLEFFGVFEVASGDRADDDTQVGGQYVSKKGSYTQIGAEALYRFGATENFYVGARYNSVSGKAAEAAASTDISRINVGGGWFMTRNVLAKLEYVNQSYGGDGYVGSKFEDGKFNGIVFEAVIQF